MSSFRRHTGGGGEAVPSTRSLPGTRPWVNGQTLTSTGNRDLDGIVGGGLCLGTITVIEEDRFSDYALTLARYFLAQGVAAGHRCLVVGTEGKESLAEFISSLPAALEDRHKANESSGGQTDSSEASTLKIAWQYQKYISPKPSSEGPSGPLAPRVARRPEYCTSFDLSSSFMAKPGSDIGVLDVSRQARQGDYGAIAEALTAVVAGLPPGVVLRVVIKSFLSTGSWATSTSTEADSTSAALQFLYSLRRAIQGLPVVVMLSVPSHHLKERSLKLLYRVVDSVLAVDSFAGQSQPPPPEFREFVGFLYIKHVNALAAARGASNKYGIKRDRRKLHIEPLHLPPEDARALTEDVERSKKSAGRRGTALEPGVACASGLPGKRSDLDF